MSFRMMLSMLRRHPMMPLLVLLQVAVACAILANVLFMSWQKLRPMLAPSGMDTANLIVASQITCSHCLWSAAEVRAGTQALREVPGVRAASAAYGLPTADFYTFSALQGPTGVKVGVNVYSGYDLVKTLGLDLIAGRNFLPDEYRDFGPGKDKGVITPVIITAALAQRLFGQAHAIGGLLRDPGDKTGGRYRVVGIVRHLVGVELTRSHVDSNILMPRRIGKTPLVDYAIRVKSDMHAAALRGVRRVLQRQFGALMPVGSKPHAAFYDTLRSNYFKTRRGALWMLGGVAIIVLVVSVIGIIGLTGFWIQKRTHTIGILRALGARRVDILVYFQGENALIVVLAVLLGMLLAYAGNLALMRYYALTRLPLWYLPVGAVVMLVLGQLAVLGPALRASRVAPAVATRNI